MRKHLGRTILIYAILCVAAFYVYPTIGWMVMSDQQRQDRLEQWKKEDSQPERLSFWQETEKKLKRWAECDRDMVINLGLDLQGGVQMVIGIDVDKIDPELKKRLEDRGMTEAQIIDEMQRQVRQTIERRSNEFGAKEPIIQTMGDRQIQVQLPGEKDVERAKELILKTAYLTFHIVAGPDQTAKVLKDIDDHFQGDFLKRLQRPGPNSGGVLQVPMNQIDYVRDLVNKAEKVPGLIPDNLMVAFGRKPKPWDEQSYGIYVLHKETIMTGDGLTGAAARPDEKRGGSWMILFSLDNASGRVFGEKTKENLGKPMAIVVDGVVESAPTIQGQITTSGSITGRFSRDEAQDLAIALNSGSLPVPIVEQQTGVVGPRLGAESINKGIWSAIIGLVVVMAFMLIYYRLAGIVANVALGINALLIIASLAYFGATLTLPGIAGLILTIGMAVDANVLIYERMREETRNGKSFLASIEGGYTHATSAIMDSNITTLIAAAVLLQFGSGPIQGFAVTLGIGVCSSVFTALIVTRALFDFMAERKWVTKLTMMHVIPADTNVPFLNYRRIAVIFSIAGIIIGLGIFGVRGNKNFGVDFTTGTNLVLALHTDKPIGEDAVRSSLTEAKFVEPTVTAYEQSDVSEPNRFIVHLGETGSTVSSGAQDSIGSRVQKTLAPLVGGDASKVEIEKEDMVGPTVGRQLKWDALKSIIYSIIFIIGYLWFRFELNFSVGAVVALFHDVGITLGLFALTGRQISLGVVAAILTIIGYSLNDTIIVYDRIREDMKLYRGRGMSLLEIMNRAVNETLSRTLLTSGTTMFVVLVLFAYGGETINDFAFALIVGIVVGTYSSIFIASPVVYLWNQLRARTKVASSGDGQAGPPARYRKKSGKSQSDDGSSNGGSKKSKSVENPA